MNENNMQNTGNGYPQSGYQQSGYPQSEYPQSQQYPISGIPYPMSGYGEQKKSKSWGIILAVIVGVVILALAVTLTVVIRNRNQMNGAMPPPPPQMGTVISISNDGAMINGQAAEIDFFNEDGKAYLKLEDIAKTAGYDCTREGNEVKMLSQAELAILKIGSTEVTLQDQASKSTSTVEILNKPFEKDGGIYIYARDLSVFLKNTNVSYNSMTGAVEITIGMNNPPQPPQGGQMPPGGQPPQEAQPQNNAAPNAQNGGAANGEAPREMPGGQPPKN